MEAELIVRTAAAGGQPASWRAALFARDFNQRRVHQKALFYRLPARPVIKFVLMYFVRGGFLDGRAGLTYALLQAYYEYLIVLKTREIAQNSVALAPMSANPATPGPAAASVVTASALTAPLRGEPAGVQSRSKERA